MFTRRVLSCRLGALLFFFQTIAGLGCSSVPDEEHTSWLLLPSHVNQLQATDLSSACEYPCRNSKTPAHPCVLNCIHRHVLSGVLVDPLLPQGAENRKKERFPASPPRISTGDEQPCDERHNCWDESPGTGVTSLEKEAETHGGFRDPSTVDCLNDRRSRCWQPTGNDETLLDDANHFLSLPKDGDPRSQRKLEEIFIFKEAAVHPCKSGELPLGTDSNLNHLHAYASLHEKVSKPIPPASPSETHSANLSLPKTVTQPEGPPLKSSLNFTAPENGP